MDPARTIHLAAPSRNPLLCKHRHPGRAGVQHKLYRSVYERARNSTSLITYSIITNYCMYWSRLVSFFNLLLQHAMCHRLPTKNTRHLQQSTNNLLKQHSNVCCMATAGKTTNLPYARIICFPTSATTHTIPLRRNTVDIFEAHDLHVSFVHLYHYSHLSVKSLSRMSQSHETTLWES